MRYVIPVAIAAVLCACGDQTATHPVADLVITNGNVITVDDQNPAAQAVAINGDRITAVGNVADIAAYIGDTTEVIDL